MELEERLKIIFSRKVLPPSPCPDFEALAGFLEGRLNPEQETELRSHLAHCSSCQELVKLYLEDEEIYPGKIPRGLLRQAKAVFKPGSWQKFWWRVKKFLFPPEWAGQGLAFQMVRSHLPSEQGKIFSHQELIYPYQVRTEVVYLESGLFQLWVEAYNPKISQMASGLRANLKEGKRELESLVLEKGKAVFEPVPQGKYVLELWEKRDFLGGIEILIKEKRNEPAG